MRLVALLIVLLALLVGALGTGAPLLYRLVYILVAVLAASWLWARLSVRGVEGSVSPHTERPYVGQWLDETVTLVNTSRVPKFGLEVAADVPQAANLVPLGRVTWVQRYLCRRRGPLERGRIILTGRDPLGLFARRVALGETQTIVVYPRTEDLGHFFLTSADVSGRGRSRRTREVTPRIWGIRDYYPGDSFSRIHWPSTARNGGLMVKEFEIELSSEVWLLLDLEQSVQAGPGLDNTEEWGVVVASSLARRLGEDDYVVGFLAQGEQRYLLSPQRGSQQFWRIMEALALARAGGRMPLSDVVAAEARRFAAQSVLIAVTPRCDARLLMALTHLQRRGTRVVVVLLDAPSFQGQGDSAPTVGELAARGIETYLVRRGEKLVESLDSHIEGLAKVRPARKDNVETSLV